MKALVSLSGGMDSATVLGCAVDSKAEVSTVGFFYKSKHNPFENEAARKIAAYYNVPFKLIDLSGVMGSFKSALMASGDAIPEGHYEGSNMKATVVPNRNMIFLSILTGIAVSEKIDQIWLGVHAGDHEIYPDCRPQFVADMQKAILTATQWTPDDPAITLKAPFLSVTKREILQHGLELIPQVPYALTRTCYKAQPISCGRCGSCRERLSAFKSLGLEDPVEYEYRHPNPDQKD